MVAMLEGRSRALRGQPGPSVKTGCTDLGKSLALEPEVMRMSITLLFRKNRTGWSIAVRFSFQKR
jgi:hypothetical protein